MFPHLNHITVLPHNHFENKIFPQDKDLDIIIEIDAVRILTIVPDLSPQTIVTVLFTILIIQSITRAFLLLHIKTQPKSLKMPMLIYSAPIANPFVDY